MKKWFLILICALMLIMAAGWAAAENPQRDPMSIPEDTSNQDFSLPEGYDPASEEDHGGSAYTVGAAYDDFGLQIYAGATPIPLDPIDMPTPTPKPTLTFEYGAVTSDKLKLYFEAPAGWSVDASAEDAITLTDPNTIDGYQASFTIRMYSVANTFKLNDLHTELRTLLQQLGQYNFSKWSTTEQAPRTLLKKDGYYADYEGTYYDGTAIYGRVMMALLDNNRVIMLHLSCTDGYFNSSYKAVINRVRDSLKLQ